LHVFRKTLSTLVGLMIFYFLVYDDDIKIFHNKYQLNRFIYNEKLRNFAVFDLHLEPLTQFDIQDHLIDEDPENKDISEKSFKKEI
jgi:hypothetical protein